ncbi:MAG: beta-lactamase [Adhaeribacter sp.]|nr:beta-lactamase [Adhaeribacter sp.]
MGLISAIRAANETGALVLDTRSAICPRFCALFHQQRHRRRICPWVGALVPGVSQPILLITEPGREEEVVTSLARVGYDHTLLKGGIGAWRATGKELDTVVSISAAEFAKQVQAGPVKVFDVRKESEFQDKHVTGAISTPLDNFNDHLMHIPQDEVIYIHCAGGYQSMIAASILKARGSDNFMAVDGGFKAISATASPRTAYVCPDT